VKYLTEIWVDCDVMIQTQDLCFDTLSNYQLSQKFELIGNSEFDNLTK
jgi:hypothetical protein